jgi:hypothetical protein
MKLLLASAFIMMAGVALAQHHPRHGQSPYAGMEKRLVKALDDQQVADLRAGRGIGLALAAELNGFPVPCMCWSWRISWDCRPSCKTACGSFIQGMRAEAIPVGE